MHLDLAAMTDAVNITIDGKLNLIGLFGRVNAQQLPFTLPQMFLTLKFIASPGEKGTTQIVKVVLMDQDGTRIWEGVETPLQIPADVPELNPEAVLVSQLNGLTFQKYGPHSFDIMLNGASLRQVPLQVQPIPPLAR